MSSIQVSPNSQHAILHESVNATAALQVPPHDAHSSQSYESYDFNDTAVAEQLSRPENFKVDADFIENLYQLPEQRPYPGQELNSQPALSQSAWGQATAMQHPLHGYNNNQLSLGQVPTAQEFDPQRAQVQPPSNDGLSLSPPSSTPGSLMFRDEAVGNDQPLTGLNVHSSDAFEQRDNIGNFSQYSPAYVGLHQNQLENFQVPQAPNSEQMRYLNDEQQAIPQHPHNKDRRSNGSVDAQPSSSASNSQEPEGDRCGASGRRPAGRKGRPKPKTYSEVEEAIIIEGFLEGASFAEIGEDLGRPGQAVEHKIRRMKAEGKLH